MVGLGLRLAFGSWIAWSNGIHWWREWMNRFVVTIYPTVFRKGRMIEIAQDEEFRSFDPKQ
jgi:hypothetical protein